MTMFENLPDDVMHEICERFRSIVNLVAIASVSKSCVLSQDARSLAANFPTVAADLQAAWRGALVRRRRVNLRRVNLEAHLDSCDFTLHRDVAMVHHGPFVRLRGDNSAAQRSYTH